MSFINDYQIDTELTDAQVVTHLKKRRLKLVMELERVDLALKAFEQVELRKLNRLEILAVDYNVEEELLSEVDKELEALMLYSPDMTHEQKVYFALSKMQEATAVEIADFLMFQDTNMKHRRAIINAMTYMCSRLKARGKIAMRKKGHVNYYRLKE